MAPTESFRKTLFWRFSLRELLLLMIAIASMTALFATYYKRSEPFKPSKMSKSFCHPSTIQNALRRIGIQNSGLFEGGGGPGGRGEQSLSASAHYVVEIDEPNLRALLNELETEAKNQIKQEGGQTKGEGSAGGLGHQSLFLTYEIGQVFGEIHLVGEPVGEKKARMFLFLHEHLIRP